MSKFFNLLHGVTGVALPILLEPYQAKVTSSKQMTREPMFDRDSLVCECGSVDMFHTNKGGYGCNSCRTRKRNEAAKRDRLSRTPKCVDCLLVVGLGRTVVSRAVGLCEGTVARRQKDLGVSAKKRRFSRNKVLLLSNEEAAAHRRKLQSEYERTPSRKIARSHRKRLSRKSIKGWNARELGCSEAFFKKWISAQFTHGMSWDNHGTYWHFDHKLPLCSFDLSKPAERAIAFHYTNIRPLRSKENLRKGTKLLAFEPELPLAI